MTEKPKCKFCEKVSGIFGVLLGAIIIFISVDTLTGGYLSDLVSGGIEEMEKVDD